jgi:hypothetical protein
MKYHSMFIKHETGGMRGETAIADLRYWTVVTKKETDKPQPAQT